MNNFLQDFKKEVSLNRKNINEKEIIITGFDRAYGVATKENKILIPDFNRGAVYEFNTQSNKTYILNKVSDKLCYSSCFKKSVKESFLKPHDIYIDDEMNIYISEMGLKNKKGKGKISVYDKNYNFIKNIGLELHNYKGLIDSIMTYKSNEMFYITENGSNKILRFNNNFEFIDWIGEDNQTNKFLKQNSWSKSNNFININLLNPHAVKIGPKNEIYIVDTGNHRILKFSQNGKFKGWIGKKKDGEINDNWQKEGISVKGSELGAFNAPCDLTIIGDFMYVSEVYNNRVVKINLEGKNYGWIGIDKYSSEYFWSKENINRIELNNPFGIKIKKKAIFIADRGNNRIKIIHSSKLF